MTITRLALLLCLTAAVTACHRAEPERAKQVQDAPLELAVPPTPTPQPSAAPDSPSSADEGGKGKSGDGFALYMEYNPGISGSVEYTMRVDQSGNYELHRTLTDTKEPANFAGMRTTNGQYGLGLTRSLRHVIENFDFEKYTEAPDECASTAQGSRLIIRVTMDGETSEVHNRHDCGPAKRVRKIDELADSLAAILTLDTLLTNDSGGGMPSATPFIVRFNACEPAYPVASEEGEGMVEMQFSVDAGSNLTGAKIVNSSGNKGADEAILSAIKQCEFKAGTNGGAPAAMQLNVKYAYVVAK